MCTYRCHLYLWKFSVQSNVRFAYFCGWREAIFGFFWNIPLLCSYMILMVPRLKGCWVCSKDCFKSVKDQGILWKRSCLNPLIENYVLYLKRCKKTVCWNRDERLTLNHRRGQYTSPLNMAKCQNCGFYFLDHKTAFTAFWTEIQNYFP